KPVRVLERACRYHDDCHFVPGATATIFGAGDTTMPSNLLKNAECVDAKCKNPGDYDFNRAPIGILGRTWKFAVRRLTFDDRWNRRL
ncbi:MAG: hypothetical protein ABI164_07810, partial [Acidobacteriaceae bacterium]